MKKKIAIIDYREEGFEMEKKAFAAEHTEVFIYSCKNEDELIESIWDAHVIIFTYSMITENVIDKLTNCQMLIRYGIGLDNIDVEAASKKGILVCNAPNYGVYAVAEHAFALLMCLNRKLKLLDQCVRDQIWSIKSISPVFSLKDKTLGIVGFGNIGRYVCEMANAFQMKAIIFDPFVDNVTASKYRARLVSFDDLIKQSDHITLHAPLRNETRNLFNKKVFQKMKNTSILINTSRGGLINESDLIMALKSKRLAGAGLDVFDNEPMELHNELLNMENVILTPHVAWYTEESIINLHQEIIDEVLRVLRGRKPQNSVNFQLL
jgi:D-3-phosphoglycerate dehydrogenase / 2-oxoglutarate reductase